MRRFLLALVFAVALLCCPVSADNAASSAAYSANITADGSCQVTLELQLNLDTPSDSFLLPLPASARSITVNGKTTRTQRSDNAVTVDLSEVIGNATGAYSVRVQYTLPNVLVYGQQEEVALSLPLLSGFHMPMHGFSFSVTLPGTIEASPQFFSGYYQQSIEADMRWSVNGNQVSGSVLTALKERETLQMKLDTPKGMFPAQAASTLRLSFAAIAIWVFVILALLYWLIFLSAMPLRPLRTSAPPEGCTAGQASCRLMGQGGDLTMAVFSWAQLGYILIHTDVHGRVTLHKRMEMGNERSPWEVRLFRDLFGKRSTLDGTGYRYANLCRRVAKECPERKHLFRKGGSIRLFRALAAGAGCFCGVELGSRLAGAALLAPLLILLLAALGVATSWLLQDCIRGLRLHYRHALLPAAIAGGLWLLLGLAAGAFSAALWLVIGQMLAGILASTGGRRTEMGRQCASEILGLRRYLNEVTADELQLIASRDPGYFFTIAPWALVLGAEKRLASRFGKKRLPTCPWLTSGMDAHMTAEEWSRIMRQTVKALDRLQQRLPLERLIGNK